jgi:hypothetical protein
VVRHGSLEFFSGHGVADIASNTPITEDTVFGIGSITKTFTGTYLGNGRVAETIRGMRMAMAVNALGLPAVALPVRHRRRSPSVGTGDRPSVPRGSLPRCRGRGGGQTRHHHADRSEVSEDDEHLDGQADRIGPADVGGQ